MERIVLIRHGETAKNVEGVMHGSDDAELLTPLGIKQIKKTAEKLKGYSPSRVYSSKEARSIQSGELIAKELSMELESVDGMQERDWGELSNQPWSEIQKILDPMNLEERYDYVPPGGESWRQFEERLIKALSLIIENCRDETVVVVTHGGAIRALMPFLIGAPKEESFKHDPDNASITVFNQNDGTLVLETLSNTSHLQLK
ncbi:MAG: histidine phosphatase family protein [Candidatus Liptonbacteria bacterium]